MSRFRGQFEALLASVSFGTAPFFAKKGLMSVPNPLYGVAIAILSGMIVNIFFVFFSGEWKKLGSIKHRGLIFTLLAGGCNTVAILAYYWAMSLGKMALVVPISCIYPLFTLVAAYIFLRKSETLDRWTIIGVLLIVGGIILTV